MARRERQGRSVRAGAGVKGAAIRGARPRVARRRRGGSHQPPARARPALQRHDDRRLPALATATSWSRSSARWSPTRSARSSGRCSSTASASEGLRRSRIASHVAVASAIYSWALTPSRRFVSRNPLRLVELPPNDEKPRLRVAFAPEAAQLLAALEPADAVPYAIAFYAGLRRAEIDRLDWTDVLDEQGAIGSRLLVGRAKSAAGTERRPPIAAPLRIVLSEAWMRQGRPTRGRVVEISVMSGKLASRAARPGPRRA